MTIAEFAEAVVMYCSVHDGSVTSWGRTTIHNKEVGGVVNSSHRFFRGADIVYDKPDITKNTQRIVDAQRVGLLLIPEGDHDHLQPLGWGAG